ncbi:uncharacterized protein RHIMIDRAFT_310142 [Rhizopus microsporus ATCC 52813]|uniref:MULE transposase domain-containing protein n=1 Tax=Rhizopus microsporus ATCC 52813 TaxID=1340429 RepID=A0A2G4T8S1_RHIZD|nr:uncharacterized protein RHIMIDRAFT_310142 [Rhizopus microsporus ATCC 52813]PHZ17418.1 hypothetical protein RHIMIDRAFT_310142 [Rhizopus microsporus ATCC 52813]
MPDSIAVDATYKTNTHKLTFINIAGTSNVTSTSSGRGNLQTFPVDSAWMNNELETTYTWIFQQLKESIWPTTQHRYPEVFVTDNGKSVNNVIKAVGTLSLTSEKRLLLSLPAHRNVLELQLEEALKKIAFCKTNEEMNKSIEEFEKFLKAPGHYKDAGSKGVEYLKAYAHFGNKTTNRVKSAHAAIKTALGRISSGKISTVTSKTDHWYFAMKVYKND